MPPATWLYVSTYPSCCRWPSSLTLIGMNDVAAADGPVKGLAVPGLWLPARVPGSVRGARCLSGGPRTPDRVWTLCCCTGALSVRVQRTTMDFDPRRETRCEQDSDSDGHLSTAALEARWHMLSEAEQREYARRAAAEHESACARAVAEVRCKFRHGAHFVGSFTG